MALEYGFYNSTQASPVKYYAEQFGRLFDGIIKDGVFQSIGQHFIVTASTGLNVSVGTGRAWFNNTWTYLDAAVTKPVASNSSLIDRIDAVVLEIDKTNRTNSIKVITGSSSSPSLSNTDALRQVPLAYVTVKPQASSLTNADITNKVGSAECPFVTGLMETLDASDLYNQWSSSFTNFMTASNSTFNAFMNGLWKPEDEDEYTQVMQHVAAMGTVRTASFNKNNWTETATNSKIYSQTVTVNGMDAAYNPQLVSALPSNATEATAANYNAAFSVMSAGRGTTASNSVTWYCYGAKPTTTITVGFRGQ